MQNTVTRYLQVENLKYLQKFDIPVVVYSYAPEQWWDHTDNVPNPLRYYLISNYIFNHYEPFSMMSGHSIWIKKEINLKNKNYQEPDSALNSTLPHYDLKFLPGILAASHEIKRKNILKIWDLDHIQNNSFSLPDSFPKTEGNTLSLEIPVGAEGTSATLAYFKNGKKLGTFTFFLEEKKRDLKYEILISTQYNWHKYTPDRISIEFSRPDIKLSRAILLKGLVDAE
jgi:hypothetical protein